MKRILCAGAFALVAGGQALAADLPPPPAPPPRAPATYVPAPIPVYNWTGFYIGGNVGGLWKGGSYTDQFGDTFSSTGNKFNFMGGAQVGVNYEFAGGFLIGAEADFDFLPNSNNTTSTTLNALGPLGVTPASVTLNNNWITTATGRLGYAWDRFLVYGKGGGAWVGTSNPTITLGGVSTTTSTSSSNLGWTAGAGVEWAFWNTVSVRVEYDYIGLNNQTISAGGYNFSSSSRNIQFVNLGLNYKFGWGY
jgi:outer membrane immunogenic protein